MISRLRIRVMRSILFILLLVQPIIPGHSSGVMYTGIELELWHYIDVETNQLVIDVQNHGREPFVINRIDLNGITLWTGDFNIQPNMRDGFRILLKIELEMNNLLEIYSNTASRSPAIYGTVHREKRKGPLGAWVSVIKSTSSELPTWLMPGKFCEYENRIKTSQGVRKTATRYEIISLTDSELVYTGTLPDGQVFTETIDPHNPRWLFYYTPTQINTILTDHLFVNWDITYVGEEEVTTIFGKYSSIKIDTLGPSYPGEDGKFHLATGNQWIDKNTGLVLKTYHQLPPEYEYVEIELVNTNIIPPDTISQVQPPEAYFDYYTEPVVSFYKLFAQEYRANMQRWETTFLFADALTALTLASYIMAPAPDPVRLSILAGSLLTTITGRGLDLFATLMSDPPDENFREAVTFEPAPPVAPYDDSHLAHAHATLATTLLQQNAILDAMVVTLERLQGAEQANEPTFVALQATTLRGLSSLLVSNQQELHRALTSLGTEIVAAVEPVHGEVKHELDRLSAEGLSPEEQQQWHEAGVSLYDIETIDGIFQSLQIDDGFHEDAAAALYQWANWIDEAGLPALEQGVKHIDTLLEDATPTAPVKPGINWPAVGGIVAAVVAVGLVVFFLRRRRPA